MAKKPESIYIDNVNFEVNKDLTKITSVGKQEVIPSGMFKVNFKGREYYVMRYFDSLTKKEGNYILLTKIDNKFVQVMLDDYDLFYEYADSKKRHLSKIKESLPKDLEQTQIIECADLLSKLNRVKYNHHVIVPTYYDEYLKDVCTDYIFKEVKINNKDINLKDAMYKELENKLALLKKQVYIKVSDGSYGNIQSYCDNGIINKKVHLIAGIHKYIPEYLECDSFSDYKEGNEASYMLVANDNSSCCYNHDGMILKRTK